MGTNAHFPIAICTCVTVLLTGHVLDSAFKKSLRERFRSCHSDSYMCETQKCSQFTMSKPIWKFFYFKERLLFKLALSFSFFFFFYLILQMLTGICKQIAVLLSCLKQTHSLLFSIYIIYLHHLLHLKECWHENFVSLYCFF